MAHKKITAPEVERELARHYIGEERFGELAEKWGEETVVRGFIRGIDGFAVAETERTVAHLKKQQRKERRKRYGWKRKR
jgi:hypothetical protein